MVSASFSTEDKAIGYVAEFCIVCRTLRPFDIISHVPTTHIAFICVDKGKVTHTAVCDGCGMEIDVDSSNYITTLDMYDPPMDKLIATTFPNVEEVYADRLAVEDKLVNGLPLSDRERLELIQEPFDAFGSVFQSTAEYRRADGPVILSGVMAFAAPLMIILFALAKVEEYDTVRRIFIPLASAVGVLGFVLFVCFATTAKMRWIRKHVLPLVYRSLAPLNPSRIEIREALQSFIAAGTKIANKLDPDTVFNGIQAERMRPRL